MSAALVLIPWLSTPVCAGPIPFHAQYAPLDDPKAEKFLADAIKEAVAYLGKPAIPIKTVHLRLSRPIDPKSKLRRDFQLTELVDADKGEMAIYLSRRPGEYAFAGQLAHEVAHLLNPRLYDCYVEGLNTCFAERLLKKNKLDWSGWDKYLRDGSDPFYGSTYQMMTVVSAAAGDEHVRALLGFARWSNKEKTRMSIDIDAWLGSLPKSRREQVRAAILEHVDAVSQANRRLTMPNGFMVPK